MNLELSENETYRFFSKIHHPKSDGGSHLDRVMEILDVCYGNDGKLDSPSLRIIDFRVIFVIDEPILTVSAYFRSWDLWAGRIN